MALKDEVVKLLDKSPGRQFTSGEIQNELEVPYPISGILATLADDKSIRKVKRGVYTSRAVTRREAPSRNGHQEGSVTQVGTFTKTVAIEASESSVKLHDGDEVWSISWSDLTDLVKRHGVLQRKGA